MKIVICRIAFVITLLGLLYPFGIQKYLINKRVYNQALQITTMSNISDQLYSVDRIIEQKKDWSIPYFIRAKIYYDNGDYSKAGEDIKNSIDYQPPKMEGMLLLDYFQILKNPPKEEAIAEARNQIESTFMVLFKTISPITVDWVTWMVYCFVPICCLTFVAFFIPDHLHNSAFSNLWILTGIFSGIIFLCIFLCSLLIEMAPSWIAIGLVMVFYTILNCQIFEEFRNIFTFNKNIVQIKQGFWICKKCQTENTYEHQNCWNCRNDKE